MKQTLKIQSLLMFLLITTMPNIYSQVDQSLINSESSDKKDDFYIRVEGDFAFSKTIVNNSISYKLAVGLGNNEFGFSRAKFYSDIEKLITYQKSELKLVFILPLYVPVDEESVNGYEFNMSSVFYSRVINIASWLDLTVGGSIGYGSGFVRTPINEKTVKYGNSLGEKSERIYTCDFKERKLEAIVTQIAASLELKICKWWKLSVGKNYYFSEEIKNPKFRLATSILLFTD